MNIHCWDPGRTTGYALLQIEQGRLQFVRGCTYNNVHDLTALAHTWIHTIDYPEIFVVEEFVLYPGSTKRPMGERSLIWNDMPAAIVRGQIEFLADWLHIEVKYQKAANMKPFASAGLLKSRLGLTKLPASEHIRDAMRHGCYYAFSHQLVAGVK